MRKAFRTLSSSRRIGSTSARCQSAIVMITDREMDQSVPQLTRELNANFTRMHGIGASVKVFVNSITAPDHDMIGTAERNVTCANGGIWNKFTASNLTDLYEKLTGYYRVLSRSLHITQPVWLELNHNSSVFGVVSNGTGLCLPVYNRTDQAVLGVSCTVLPLTEVERTDPGRGMEVSLGSVSVGAVISISPNEPRPPGNTELDQK